MSSFRFLLPSLSILLPNLKAVGLLWREVVISSPGGGQQQIAATQDTVSARRECPSVKIDLVKATASAVDSWEAVRPAGTSAESSLG